MADLDTLIRFADDHGFNLTGVLTHEQVERLAQRWLPEIRFDERERFHPIALDDFLTKPPEVIAQLTEEARNTFRVEGLAADGSSRRFDPPVLWPSFGSRTVLNTERTIEEALELREVDKDAVLTNGNSYDSAIQSFGGSDTVSGVPVPSPNDPRKPRWDLRVMAEMKMLIETFKYELLVEQAGEAYPRDEDGLRGGFEIVSLLFSPTDDPEDEVNRFPRSLMVEILLQLILAHEAGESGDTETEEEVRRQALDKIPQGWILEHLRWNLVKRLAFLEFYFFYAYNDYDQYGSEPFVNHHEGDVEGCCLVFEREALEAEAGDPDTLVGVRPVSLITSVHDEEKGLDRLKLLDPELSPEQFQEELRVYVAAGSHATYLRPGTHDILDFLDVLTLPFDDAPWIVITHPDLIMAACLWFAVCEHFDDAVDVTSDDGIIASSPEVAEASDSPRVFGREIMVTPLSGPPSESEEPIYSEGKRRELRVRGFDGFLGGHDPDAGSFLDVLSGDPEEYGRINHSSTFENKTGRYFRKLIRDPAFTTPIVE